MRKYLAYSDVSLVPKFSEITTRSECSLKTQLTPNISLDLPIISAPMDSVSGLEMCLAMSDAGGIGCLHRFMSIEDQAQDVESFYTQYSIRQELVVSSKSTFPDGHEVYSGSETIIEPDPNKHLIVAIGVTGDYWERLQATYNAGARTYCLDVAHGDSQMVVDAIRRIKSNYSDVEVIAGNVATREGAVRLDLAGADCVRVGIAGGSACSTAIKTGFGLPMFSCLQDVEGIYPYRPIPYIADGSIKTPSDAAKALAVGAKAIMIGGLISGTKESPGEIMTEGTWPEEYKFKRYRGSASAESKNIRGEEGRNIEGVSAQIPYKGKVKRILNDISDALKSSLSYAGATNLQEFKQNVEFVEITNSGLQEAKPRI